MKVMIVRRLAAATCGSALLVAQLIVLAEHGSAVQLLPSEQTPSSLSLDESAATEPHVRIAASRSPPPDSQLPACANATRLAHAGRSIRGQTRNRPLNQMNERVSGVARGRGLFVAAAISFNLGA